MIKDYHFNIDNVKPKIPLILDKSNYERIRSNKFEDFTIYKDEILKIFRKSKDLYKHIEDL